jgi:ankyrin repeat protein
MEEVKTLVLTEAESSSNDSLPNVFMLARHNRRGELEQLFKKGVDPDSIDRYGNSLFLIACQNNHKETAKLCLRYGGDIHWKNNKGWGAIRICKMFKYELLAEYLKTKGALET